ncbi:hypothetical protein [Streptomyces rubradiris]|uniref:Integral-membrane protein n=1 Tax=Streptomyces rubradiris TaxID=285531 RepID=A0ABQ3RB09_STRRR|nr:hypothetical protein [Streptomyces rubradiris]GHH19251.1 hypothetical protein GCM10018792_51810 [Streptomyces rubradiris]GHI53047.1 hypothetical protein Srubr_28930 [Streptomyces rubradiris]
MRAGWCSRTLRAAVFAAVCVLLAALGHVVMSGAAVPWWAMAAGAAMTGGTAWLLAARERGPTAVGSLVVAAQAVLHASFTLTQAVVHPRPPGGGSLGRQWLGYLLHGSPPGPGPRHGVMPTSMASMDHTMGSMHSMGPMAHMGAAHPPGHSMSGMSSAGMLTAHLLAALLCGLWLAYGERAAFRILRVLAGWLVAPLRLTLRLPVPPYRPRLRARRGRSDGTLRRLLLTRAVTSRGPPVGCAVA